MKTLIFLSITLLFNEFVMCQNNKSEIEIIVKDGFTTYREKTWQNYKGTPKDKNGNEIDFRGASLESVETLKNIYYESFSDETISLLKDKKWFIDFLISSDGTIVSVGLVLKGDVTLKLYEISDFFTKVKKQLHFNLFFNGQVETEGYIVQMISNSYINR